jgi:proteasome lid subunit RPN8/RPN11
MGLTISIMLADRIREQGRRTYPNECCGLLLGKADRSGKKVFDLRPVKNVREDSKHNRYLISPKDLLAAEKDAARRGLDVIGVYHSHPDHPARPSEFDRENAFPWYSYVILRVAGGDPSDLTSWVLREDRSEFDPEELVQVLESENILPVRSG